MNWYSRIRDLFRGAAPAARPPRASADHDDGASTSSHELVPGRLTLRAGVVSAVGNYRPHNEDNFYVPGRTPVQRGGSTESNAETAALSEHSNLFIVADGMGGQQAGEEASRMAVEIIPASLARRLPPGDVEPRLVLVAIRDAVAEANQEILGTSGSVIECSDMGTTVVLALFRGPRLYVAGLGDSRAYRFRDGKLEQLTSDHTVADALHRAGTITREELSHHPFKNRLYLFLGSKDARGGPEEIRTLDVKPGDRLLLASDGLTGAVTDEEIAELIAQGDDPQAAARGLRDRALNNDSRDNVTCLVVFVVAEPQAL